MLFKFYKIYLNIFEMRIRLPAVTISKGACRIANIRSRRRRRMRWFFDVRTFPKVNFLFPVL